MDEEEPIDQMSDSEEKNNNNRDKNKTKTGKQKRSPQTKKERLQKK